MHISRSLQLFLIDGRPDGMLTAEVFNWTGHVLQAPRTQLKEALKRQETSFTGVYLLLGEESGKATVYIGEAEDMGDRVRSHDTNKDWWTHVIFITSNANNLHKAHVKYLEARMVEAAKAASQMALANSVTPKGSSLSEADEANMDTFFDVVKMVLPALRVDVFMSQIRQQSVTEAQETNSPIFERHIPKYNIKATAILENGEFIVQAGSTANRWISKHAGSAGYQKLHQSLIEKDILQPEGEVYIFAQSYAFNSPSAAGAVVSGRSSNGQIEWVLQGSSQTYYDWEQANLQAKDLSE